MSQSTHRPPAQAAGFTMIEVVTAIFVLTVGLLAVAALTGKMMTTGRQSKYMTVASTLASEKLEDLNRWDPKDPQVCVPTGSTAVGSLTADITQTTVCPPPGSASETVSYFDDVTLGATDGAFSETVSTISNGNLVYLTTVHAADGSIQTSPPSSTPPAAVATFHRRWIIEGDAPVAGVRRVTVLVTLQDATVQPAVKFQMSMVRP
ncbi:MAG: type IV pilus modification PilV family protein [Terriglobia bacterium]